MTKEIAVPSYASVDKAGDILENTGIAIAIICTAIGAATLVFSGNPAPLAGIALGLLLMIAGHTKKIAAMAHATYTMKCIESGRMAERQVGAEQ